MLHLRVISLTRKNKIHLDILFRQFLNAHIIVIEFNILSREYLAEIAYLSFSLAERKRKKKKDR